MQPGIVAGLLPFLLVQDNVKNIADYPLNMFHYSGIILFLSGIVITIKCIISFAIEGRGTLSPADPTKKLVAGGLYKYSRNPMYIGVILILTGESIFFNTPTLWIFSFIVFTVFNIFIVYFEEPRLKKDFKDEYLKYNENVRRWI